MNTSFPFHFDSQNVDIAAVVAGNQAVVGAAAALGAALIWYLVSTDSSRISRIRGWPLIGQWVFFTKRHDFILDGFHKLPGQSMFSFNILKHNVVALKGEEGRKAFYDRRDLSLPEGYRLLFGGGPSVKDIAKNAIPEKDDKEGLSDFIRRLSSLLRMDRLAKITPQLMADLERNMIKWGNQGQFDPFDAIYSLVFQLTIRAAACREIADSIEECKKMETLYWHVEKGSTPTSVLLPWFPSPARNLKMAATTELYTWFDGIIKARQQEGRREDDALQTLLDLGDSTAEVIEFTLGTLFAGIINTGLMSAWIFIYLDQAPEWRVKVVQELQSLLDKYAPVSRGYTSAAERFSDIPPNAWENEMPVLELCLRETIRMIVSGATLRRVVHGDVEVEGKVIPNGSFLVYLTGETHNDPNIYPEPSKFNPGRFEEGQDKAQVHGFLGWGVGRHPCAGRRFAQYEIKAICAMFLASYDYEVVNSKGVRPDPSTTIPDRNNLYQARPKGETFYIKYTKRDQSL
ncbi:hypothetical protein FS749_000590 [Ceratobasidium sp. UAMH 11750]|nr:hypothetical protein FS749_000590 [Ceratobasidium sp. UAMH 11750]